MQGKTKYYLKVSDEDIQLLFFLWRWKLASASALSQRFYPNQKKESKYVRLNRLAKNGFIKRVFTLDAGHFFWSLTKEGFYMVKSFIPGHKNEFFKHKDVYHDYLLTAFHLGELLEQRELDEIELFSRQELTHLDFSYYPTWVPCDNQHTPDGYIRIQKEYENEFNLYALECEPIARSKEDYFWMELFYNEQESIDRVFWLISSKPVAKSIERKLHDSGRDENNKHNFILIRDFLKHGWSALICRGPDKGKNFKIILCSKSATNLQNFCNSLCTFALLDGRKSLSNQDLTNHAAL